MQVSEFRKEYEAYLRGNAMNYLITSGEVDLVKDDYGDRRFLVVDLDDGTGTESFSSFGWLAGNR